jgi:hypothetical protein
MRGSSIQKSLNRTAAQEHEIVSCFMHPFPVHERKVGHEFPFDNNLTIFDSWILELFVEAEPTGGYSIYILIRDYPKQLQIRLFASTYFNAAEATAIFLHIQNVR